MAPQLRPNAKLRDQRLVRDLTQEELAEELTQLRWRDDSDAPPVTGSMVSRWERGRRPSQVHRRLLASYFGADHVALGLRPGSSRYDIQSGGSATDRRAFLKGAAGTVVSVATVPTSDPLLTAMERLHHLAGSTIGAAVDGFEAVISDLGLTYSREPVARLYTRLDALLGTVQTIIDSKPADPYRRRLRSLAGWGAGLMANALYDMEDSPAARMNAALALEYGRLADDARLSAYVYDRQAMFAAEAGQLADALALVQRGLAVAPEATAIRARLRSAGARLHARLGGRDDALAALAVLQNDSGRLPAAEVGEGSFGVSDAFLDGAMGSVFTTLGDLQTGELHLRRIVDHYAAAVGTARRPTRLACARLNLAVALAQQGRPDEAASIATVALTTDRLVAPVLMRAAAFGDVLSGRWPGLPEASEFRERYLTLEAGVQQ